MEVDKAAHQHPTRSRHKSTKLKRTSSKKDEVIPVCKRSKAAGKKFHVEASRCCLDDKNKQIKCCYVVLERHTEDTVTPKFRQGQELETVKISNEQYNVQHRNKVNLESSHLKVNEDETNQTQTDGDETCLTQYEQFSENEITITNLFEEELQGNEHLTKQCVAAVSKMRNILKLGPTNQDNVSSSPQCDSDQIRQCQGSENTRREIQNNSQTVSRQFNTKPMRQYEARSKRKSQCRSDSDTYAVVESQMKADTNLVRQEEIVAGQQNLSDQVSLGTKQTSKTNLRGKITTDNWTFSKHQIEEQGRRQCNIDAVQIDEAMYDVLLPDEYDDITSEHNIELGGPCERDTQWTGRLSALAAWRGKGSMKGVRRHPVSEVKAADEAELVYRFWAEDAQEVYRKEKAMSYLSNVKKAYRQSPQIYNKFVDLVRSLKVTTKPTKDIRQEVCKLFEDNPHLLTGFNMFLPTDTTDEILDETGITRVCRKKLVSHNIDQPTIKDTPRSVTDSTVNSIGGTSAHSVKDTLAYPAEGSIVKNTSKIVNITWMNPKKSPSEDSSMDSSMLDSSPLSTNVTSHPAIPVDTVDGTYLVKESSKPYLSKSTNQGADAVYTYTSSSKPTEHVPGPITMGIAPVCQTSSQSVETAGDLQLEKTLSERLHESRQYPQATKGCISQPSPQLTTHPTQFDELPISEPTAQTVAETTHQLKAKAVIQQSSHDDMRQGTATHLQTEILIGSEAETGTDRGWGAEGESQNINQLGIEAASQSTKESVMEKQLRPEVKSQIETHQEKAISYLNAVKTAYRQSPQIYNKFVDLVRSLKVTTKSPKEIRQEISMLFEGNPHLIKGFNMFLPTETTEEILDETGVTEGCQTKLQNKLVTQHVDQPTDTLGPVSDSTIHSVGETSAHKDTLSYPVARAMLKSTSTILNSPWMNLKKGHSEEISKLPRKTIDEQIRSILNIPIVYPERNSSTNASEISMGCPTNQGSIHPTEYTMTAVPPVPVEQSHSLHHVDSVASAPSTSVLNSSPLSTNVTNHSVMDTGAVDGTCSVNESPKPFVLKFINQGADLQETTLFRDAVHTYTSSFPQFPQATNEGCLKVVSQPTEQLTLLAETETTTQLNAEMVIQPTSPDDIKQGTEAQSQTEILIGSESETEMRWGPEEEAKTENLTGTESETQIKTHLEMETESQIENHLGMVAAAQTMNIMITEVESQSQSHQWDEAELKTESHQETESQIENHKGAEAKSQTESDVGMEAGAQVDNQVGNEAESKTGSYQGVEAESQTENRLGMEAEAQTEKLCGSEATSQTESKLGVEVESQTENQQGTDAAFQTESQARTEMERQTESDQQTLLPNAQPSVSNMELQNVDPVYVDEEKALSYVLETSEWVTRQMVRQMETEAKSSQVLTGERSVNKVTLLGRVGRPAEMRGTADYPVTVFPLATSISIKRDDGTYEQQTEWHRISIFRKGLRDIAAASITTGDRVFVSGSIKYGSFEQDGRTVYSTSIVADDVIRLTAKAGTQSSSGTSGME